MSLNQQGELRNGFKIDFFTPSLPLKNNLVILRAGNQTIHRSWEKLNPPDQRNWDIIVSYYGDGVFERTFEDGLVRQRKWKWSAIYDLIVETGIIEKYDRFFFPDDDIMTTWRDINALFDIVQDYELAVAQPALTRNSPHSYPMTLKTDKLILRYTNFVELMMPCFSRDALRQCVGTFEGAVTGWGLDWIWHKVLGEPKNKMAIIDAIAMQHTRPPELGDAYKEMDGIKPDPQAELARNLARYGMSSFQIKQFGLMFAPGITYSG